MKLTPGGGPRDNFMEVQGGQGPEKVPKIGQHLTIALKNSPKTKDGPKLQISNSRGEQVPPLPSPAPSFDMSSSSKLKKAFKLSNIKNHSN